MLKAVIFDMDGVISNTDRARFDILKNLVNKRGLFMDEKDYKKTVGKRTEVILRELYPKLSEIEVQEIFNARTKKFQDNPEKYIIAQPHAVECCKFLHSKGYTLAIASMAKKKNILFVLNHLKITELFTYIVCSEDVTHHKPHPEIYLKAVEKLGVEKDECFAIEDSPLGVKSAQDAGIKCVAVEYSFPHDELLNADYSLKSLDQIDENFLLNF